MLTNTNILMIRHAEKPDGSDPNIKPYELSVAGQERAQAYTIYFQNYRLKSAGTRLNSDPFKLHFLFAAAKSDQSHRPHLTIKPLAEALGLDVDTTYKDKDYGSAATAILQDPDKYSNRNLLICWHHEHILKFAAALGVDSSKLPPESLWPTPPWPDEVFGWVLQLSYDAQGNLSLALCQNEQLMYDDCGRNPPSGTDGGPEPA